MMRIVPALALWMIAALGWAAEGEWKPARGPLVTRWAKDVSADKAHPEYPRPQLVRKDWLNLNGVWQLGFAQKDEAAPLGKDLPGRILVPFPVESALSGVMKHADRLWYRRTFTVPEAWSGKRVLLHFGAIDWEATVWVNGTKLGTHRGGYDGFSFDLTESLKPGGQQELVVGVWDPTDAGTQPRGKQVTHPGGIMYTPTTGIWQTVWLEPVPEASIESLKMVPDVDGGKLRLTVRGRGAWSGYTVRATVPNQGAGSASGPVGKELVIDIPDAKRWSPDSPYLYDLRVELLDGDKAVDAVASYFGMRMIEIGKDDKGTPRILLNGKFTMQVGPLDQGFWPDGIYTAPTDEALKYDIEITKRLGFNMARKHVKVEPDRWYYWCDKLGLLVWQDMPSGDRGVAPGKGEIERSAESARDFEHELERMIDGRYNHPSIILWVVFNEGWGQFDTARLTEWTKRHDPTRLVDCASGWNDRNVGDVHDIHVYPGPGAPDPEPKRAAVLGEFGGLGLPIEGHTWTGKKWGYANMADRDELTRKYEKLLQNVWKLRDERGLSAAVYTQITDVETEANGLLTYDRGVIKVDEKRTAAANQGDFSHLPAFTVVVPTSQQKALTWHYTFEKPPADWYKPRFDASGWKEGPGGFGTAGTPGAVVRTEWKTSDIWLRREITVPEGINTPYLYLHHDEDADVYLNGILAARVSGYTTDYEEVPIAPEARAVLKPGTNLIAIHCHQTTGGQYIDVGLADLRLAKKGRNDGTNR